MTAASLFSFLWRRKRMLLLSGVATACLGFGVSRIMPVSYSSEGSLILGHQPTTNNAPDSGPSVMTEADQLQAPGLILGVVQHYDLTDEPGLMPKLRLPPAILDGLESAIASVRGLLHGSNQSALDKEKERQDNVVVFIQRHLRITTKEKSDVISLQFEAGTPELAAQVVNNIIETYLAAARTARDRRVVEIEQWSEKEVTNRRRDVDEAEQRVRDWVQTNNLTEVQGSLTSVMQLAKSQEELAQARVDLAKQQAAMATLAKGGSIAGAEETLESKSIANLKDLEGRVVEKLGFLNNNFDPRRAALESELAQIRAQIKSETQLIQQSIGRKVQIAQARVDALEKSVQSQSQTAHDSSVAGARLRQLTNDLDAKRQLLVSSLQQGEQMRIVAMQAPTPQSLFQALPPVRPARSFGAVALVLGFVCGVATAGGISVTRALSSRVHSKRNLTEVTGRPVFGLLPDVKSRDGNILVPRRTASLVTETFRAMWVALRPTPGNGNAIVVTSSEVGEGKTTIAVALARRFAEDGFRVLLVDADLRRPHVSSLLGLRAMNCLEAVIDGSISLEDAVVPVQPKLDCLLSLGQTNNPVQMLAFEQFERFIAMSKLAYDFIILDSPPVLRVADPILIAKHCQYVLFVVQAGRLPDTTVDEAMQRFPERDKVLPLLNRVSTKGVDVEDYLYGGYAAG